MVQSSVEFIAAAAATQTKKNTPTVTDVEVTSLLHTHTNSIQDRQLECDRVKRTLWKNSVLTGMPVDERKFVQSPKNNPKAWKQKTSVTLKRTEQKKSEIEEKRNRTNSKNNNIKNLHYPLSIRPQPKQQQQYTTIVHCVCNGLPKNNIEERTKRRKNKLCTYV